MRGRGKTVTNIQRLSMKILIGAFLFCAVLAGLQLMMLTKVDAVMKTQEMSLAEAPTAFLR